MVRHADDGVSMIEVLIASIILLITMLPMGILLTSVSSASADARQRQAALQLADSWVEILSNSQPPTGGNGTVLTNTPATPTAPAGVQAPPSTLAGTPYTVTAAYTMNLVNSVGQSDLCTAGQPPSPSHPGVIQLKVTVTWDDGLHSLSDTTEINYPKPGLQTEGFLAVNLGNNGQNDVLGNLAGDRLQSLPVTITQVSGNPVLTPPSFTLYPDSNGCIFAQVPVGSYNVAVGQPVDGNPVPTFSGYNGAPPFVTTSGSTTDAQTGVQVGITALQTVNLHFFDEGINTKVTYGGASAIDGGVSCPNAASITCIALGDAPTSASATWGGSGSAWSSKAVAGVTSLNQVACTTSSNATCVGVGYGASGAVIVTTTSAMNALTPDAVPAGVTDLTQVACPSNKGCYALGTSSGGPVLLAGKVGTGSDRWVVVGATGYTFTALNSITCPTSSTCELSYVGAAGAPGVLRLDGDPVSIGTSGSWSPTLTADSLPTGVASVGTITCPSAATCIATAVGDQSGPSDATVITVAVAGSGASAWSPELSFPSGASSVTGISCAATNCVAIGTVPGTVPAAVWTGDLTGNHSWAQANGIPAGVSAVTGVACGNPQSGDTVSCAIAAVTSNSLASGQLLYGSLTNGSSGSWAWNFATLPANDTVQYFAGVSCEGSPSASNATCAAVGATPGGPVVLSSASGPAGTWSDVTPASLPSSVVTGIPLEIAPSGTTTWSTQIASGVTPNATTLPNVLYPQATGYSIVAGDCNKEATAASTANLNASPGGTASATVPLGLLPIQLIGPTGAPVSGATVTITSLLCPGADPYNLPLTDATGVTAASVPYGTYSYTVTQGSTAVAHTNVTLAIGSSSIQVLTQTTVNGVTSTTTSTYYLPNLVPVAA